MLSGQAGSKCLQDILCLSCVLSRAGQLAWDFFVFYQKTNQKTVECSIKIVSNCTVYISTMLCLSVCMMTRKAFCSAGHRSCDPLCTLNRDSLSSSGAYLGCRWRSVSAPKRLFLAPKRSRRFFTLLHQKYFFFAPTIFFCNK